MAEPLVNGGRGFEPGRGVARRDPHLPLADGLQRCKAWGNLLVQVFPPGSLRCRMNSTIDSICAVRSPAGGDMP